MAEYQLIDFRTPELRGMEDRGGLDELQADWQEMADEGWRVAHIVGALTDPRILVVFERE